VLGEASLHADLRAACVLAGSHELRDLLGELLDLERGLAQHNLADRVVDGLFEARHVRTLLVRSQIDDAFKARREQLLAAVVTDPDHLLDAGHADAGEAQLHGRQLRLHVHHRCL
jgi:hypothetical protein